LVSGGRPKNSPTAVCTAGTGSSPHHHHALDLVPRDAGIAQHATHRLQGAVDQGAGQQVELGTADGHGQRLPIHGCAQFHDIGHRQGLLGRPRGHQQTPLVLGRLRHPASGLGRPIGQRMVEVVAAQSGIPAGGHHLEHPARQTQQEMSKVPPPRS
jgi:hypothetical protein